jgi:hypothetical protein
MSSAVVGQEQSPFASPQERTREMALILEAAQSCDFSEAQSCDFSKALVWIIHRQPPRGTHAMIHLPMPERHAGGCPECRLASL